jgi:hypothetical protein
MFGPIIVSLVGISLPVVAGMWLVPKHGSDGREMRLNLDYRGRLQSLMTTMQDKIVSKQPPAGLEASSSYHTG